MARKSLFSSAERNTLIAFPFGDDLIQHYTFNETDLALILSTTLEN